MPLRATGYPRQLKPGCLSDERTPGEAREGGGAMVMLVNLRRGMLALGALCLGLGVVACSPQVPAASPACDEAFTVASAAMNEHYATDPFFGA